jgi:hypothetical protein
MEAPSWLKKFSTSIKGKSKRARSPNGDANSSQLPEAGPTGSADTNDDLPEYMRESVLMVETKELPKPFLKKPMNEKAKPLKEIMHVALEEGLEKPLDQSNLGFKMVRMCVSTSLVHIYIRAVMKCDFFFSCRKWAFERVPALGRMDQADLSPLALVSETEEWGLVLWKRNAELLKRH